MLKKNLNINLKKKKKLHDFIENQTIRRNTKKQNLKEIEELFNR